MKLITAFFQLVRWPNLVFIAGTQALFYYCVYAPLRAQAPWQGEEFVFFLLLTSSVFIAAAGYIINDYFDRQIDAVNKPAKLVIDRIISRRWAILWHLILSAAGILLSIIVSYEADVWLISLINIACVIVLWLYSVALKKKLLIGNVVIACLAAWVILVIYLFAGAKLFSLGGWAGASDGFNARRFFKFTLLYAGFAFIMTIIREVIKDTEDLEGDRKYFCNTMPVAWGIPATKVFTAVWMIVCGAMLILLLLYAWQSGWRVMALYIFAFTLVPLGFLLRRLAAAKTTADYHHLSSLVKLIMLFGILSMLLLKVKP